MANELLWQHVFEHIHEKTAGPRSFLGSTGKQKEECEMQKTVTLPNVNYSDSSKDQKNLHQPNSTISVGVGSSNWGTLNHIRWGFFASQIFRLYVDTDNLKANLIVLIIFILNQCD